MPLKKQVGKLKVAVLVTCYKRPEYTKKCLKALSSSMGDVEYEIFQHEGKDGLRSAIIDFINKYKHYDIIAKIDNDCVVPNRWMDALIDIFKNSDADILSPDVFPSRAAHIHGTKDPDLLYMPSKIVGGLWCMKAELVRDMEFFKYDVTGLTGAVAILKQIINEKDPVVGWAEKVVVQDIGHWSGNHPDHIKSKEHKVYSTEVGREIAWTA